MPLRVLHITAGSDAGGVSRYLFDLCSAMRAAGHDCAIAGQRGAWHSLFAGSGIEWITLPTNGGPLAMWRCMIALRRGAFDLVHAHDPRSALISGRLGRPMLFTLHLTGMPVKPLKRVFRHDGNHAHVASQQAKRWLIDQAGVEPQRVTVIPHGIDADRFAIADDAQQRDARKQFGIEPNGTVAAYVGRYDEPKNETWLVDLAERMPRLVVLMQGQGPREAALRARIQTDRVRLAPYGDPRPVYRAADALLLPSSREGFSLVCAEAMAMGRPVLRTATAGTEEMILEGRTGQSVAIDREAFITGAIAFLADRDALARMGFEAAKHVRARLPFATQVRHTIELYERIVAGAKA
jgi:glycosyltransferase involved in cell wall biosynthesis